MESQSDSAQSHTSRAVGVSEARRRENAMSQLSHQRLFQARPSILDPSELGILAREPVESQFRRREYIYAARGDDRNLPVQTAVNRTDRLEADTIDIEILEDGTVVEILRFPVFGRYGRDPNDATWFSDSVDPRTAICSALAPYAAVRCLAGGGAW